MMTEKTRPRIPIKEGFFTVPTSTDESPKFLGTRCRDCGECFFPKRTICAKCNSQKTVDVEMSSQGTLYSFTFVHFPMFGSSAEEYKEGYGVGQVDLPEGPRLQMPLAGRQEDFCIGQTVQSELTIMRQDDAGNDLVSVRFRPMEVKS
jgi:uncharacterized OB-fold protein